MSTINHYWNIQHMRDSIERLLAASKKWKPADAVRGEATILKLEKQIEREKAEMLAGR
ncbi:hypothetical protein SAMN03159444_00136 [Pseudomonas sp. NFACC02]|uniref:hypothetical protein n=1 Tax=Pseudomonas sp. NFACC02 TaxID=1566250 RepID=UPI0008D13D8D|nr:hypothetical protein [Pseudomonas sp. NFACC02]SEP58628.1 hypothetical protein SAMN03159444_00136 [Pseudomonas sp. NFACC02]